MCSKYNPGTVQNQIFVSYTTKLFLTTNSQLQPVIKKTVLKELLGDSKLGHEFARRELHVHSIAAHPNIIKVMDVCENPEHYVLYMEYAGFESNYI